MLRVGSSCRVIKGLNLALHLLDAGLNLEIGARPGRAGSGSVPIGGNWSYLEAVARPVWAGLGMGVI